MQTPTDIIFAVEEAPEGGFTARALGFGTFTEADTMAELREMARDAVRAYFDDADLPALIRLHLAAS